MHVIDEVAALQEKVLLLQRRFRAADQKISKNWHEIGKAARRGVVALAGVITDPSRVEAREEVMIKCEAPDPEVLLVDWLNALVYEMAVRRMILARFQVNIEGNQLHGRAWGEDTDVARHEPAVEVKGATYTDLFVGQNSSGDWVAQCVVDV